jgi:hypothetical protein
MQTIFYSPENHNLPWVCHTNNLNNSGERAGKTVDKTFWNSPAEKTCEKNKAIKVE